MPDEQEPPPGLATSSKGNRRRLLSGRKVKGVGELGVLALRGLAGGSLVVVFALIGSAVKPKAFSGLFSAAPAVAIAGLAITVATESTAKAQQASTGMVLGSIAMTVSCVLAAVAIPRIQSLWGSLAAWLGWLAVDLGLYWAVFIGAH